SLGDFEKAEQFLDRSLRLDPRNGDALVDKGRLRIDAGRWQDARQVLGKVLPEHPAYDEARLLAAIAALRGDDAAAAVSELEQLVQRRPDYADAYYQLAMAYQRLHRSGEANRALERF